MSREGEELIGRISRELEMIDQGISEARSLIDRISWDEIVFSAALHKLASPQDAARFNQIWKDGVRDGQRMGTERERRRIAGNLRGMGISGEQIYAATGLKEEECR
jgi:hypothetical protein